MTRAILLRLASCQSFSSVISSRSCKLVDLVAGEWVSLVGID